MEYQDELTKIHWNTPLEEREMYDLTYKMLNIENTSKKGLDLHYLLRARELVDGMLTVMAHDGKTDLKLSDVNRYVDSCNTANDLHLLFDADLQVAEAFDNRFLKNRINSCFEDFMTSKDSDADKTFKALKSSLQRALNKNWKFEKSDATFEAYFDKDSDKVPPYTLNFAKLDGFDECVRNFMVAQLKNFSHRIDIIDLHDYNSNSPAHMANYLFSPKGNQNIFLENIKLHIEAGDKKLLNDVNQISKSSEDLDRVLLEHAERRATYLLSKTPFYLEQGNFHKYEHVPVQDINELSKQLREKPYSREPVELEGHNGTNAMETMYIRKARKYIYDNLSKSENLYNHANRILYRASFSFSSAHSGIAKQYLAWQENHVQLEELANLCKFVRENCFDRHREFTREKLPIYEKSNDRPPKLSKGLKSYGADRDDDFSR